MLSVPVFVNVTPLVILEAVALIPRLYPWTAVDSVGAISVPLKFMLDPSVVSESKI